MDNRVRSVVASNLMAVLLPCGWPGGTFAAAQTPPLDLPRAREVFALADQLRREELTTLWGTPLDCPLLLAERSSRRVVANAADSTGLLEPVDGVFSGQLPEEIAIANTAINWAGRRWTMLSWPLPARRADQAQLIAHELFHCIQPALEMALTNPVNAHLDTRDGRVWLRMEWRALEEALIEEGVRRTAALADALLFRAWRRGLFFGAAAEEHALEWNEGLAEYTGLRGGGRPVKVLADRAAVALAQWETRPSFGRGFAYASGPAYGILLDESGTSWRDRARRGADLGALAAEAYRLDLAAPTVAEVTARGARYQLSRVEWEEDARVERAAVIEADRVQRFITGPVVRLAPGGAFNFSFDPNATQSFRGGMFLPTARISDEWGLLEVTANGVLLERRDGLFTGIVLPAAANAEPPTEGDGWRLRLAEGWRVVPGKRAGDWVVEDGR